MTELDLPVGSLVLTDLHVDPEDAAEVRAFGELLERATGAPVLLLLGDLFEYWLGPSQARGGGGAELLAALAAFPGRVHLIPGNRDVLAGSELEAVLAGPLLWAGCVGRLPGGERVAFLHGDELCLADREYQRLRRLLRRGIVRGLFRALPGFVGHALARRLRRSSSAAVAAKAPLEVAQDPDAAAAHLADAEAALLVVGHTHAWRQVDLAGGGRMVVLDALGGERDMARVGPEGLDFCASAGLPGPVAG